MMLATTAVATSRRQMATTLLVGTSGGHGDQSGSL